MTAYAIELLRQPVNVLNVILGALAILGLLVMTAAAREVCRRGMIGSRQRAIPDSIAVHVLVSGEAAEAFQVRRREYLAPFDGFCRIGERVGHPVVHAKVEIR